MMTQLKVTVPEFWSDINIATFQKFKKLDFDKMSELDAMLNTVHIFCKIDVKSINKMSYKNLIKVFGQVTEVINDKEQKPLKEIIEIDGIEYGFHPCLKDITTGEFADFEHYLKGGAWENMHNLLAILYRPITSKYNEQYSIEEYSVEGFDERAELFREKLMLDAALGASVFFSDLGNELLDYFLRYSQEQLKQMSKESLKDLPN